MDEPQAPPGYRSSESKRAYGNSVTWLAVVFFLLQFAAPFLAVLVALPGFFLSGAMTMAQPRLDGAARWNGELWHFARESGPGAPAGKTILQRRAGEAEPKTVATMADPDARLLAGADRLWVIEEARVRFVKDGELQDHAAVASLGARTAPFLHQGRPAVIERNADGAYELRVLDDSGWKRSGGIRLPDLAQGVDFREVVRAVGAGPEIHLFRHDGFSVLHRVATPGEKPEGEDEWTTVGEAPGRWHPFVYADAPALAVGSAPNNADGFVRVYARKDGAWSVLLKSGLGLTRELAVSAVEGSDRLEVAVEGRMGGVKRYELSPAGDILSTTKSADGFPMRRMMMFMFVIPQAVTALLPLCFSFVLTGLMNRHRTSDHQGEELASMAARSLAALIDYVLAFLPALPAFLGFVSSFGEDGPDPTSMPAVFAAFAGGMLATLLVFLGFGVMEGLTGVTPGKWVAGIRVVGADDLRPCGVGRALLRKLLLIADGFFNGMVGLLVAGFNEKRQRVGDLLAKTVVVKRLPPRG